MTVPVLWRNYKYDRRVAYSMRALGKSDVPPLVQTSHGEFELDHVLKHDFFAATAFYRNREGKFVVLKMNRTAEWGGFSLEWMGRFLCWREMRFYRALADLPNVPKILGTVGRTGFIHEFVEGHPLSDDTPVPDGFFQQLQDLFAEVHRRDIAYVDTNKPQNILVGDDGKPHLIDFQISWDLVELWYTPLNRWWLNYLQRADIYHLLKHKKRWRPDEMTPEENELSERKGWIIRTHRALATPIRLIRRRTLTRLRRTGVLLPEGSK